MRRRALLTAGLAAAATLAIGATLAPRAPGTAPLAAALAGGDAIGLALDGAGALRLAEAAAAPIAEAPFARLGLLVAPPLPLARPAALLSGAWRGSVPADALVRLELRGWDGHGRATPWEEARGGAVTLPWPVEAAQYRLTLLAGPAGAGPAVREVSLQALPGGPAAPATGARSHRVYATRIGLIGNRTSNGHLVEPTSRFVALPSRRVLASNGGGEYQVRIEYAGRTVTVPVWDTGPWNVRDNWWDAPARRDMWNDLPTGRPQAAAAYREAYNGGRDGFGRRVRNPAGLDISDAAFYELGMTGGDEVTATLLWLPG